MLPAGIGHMAGCRLITMLVGSRGRVGLVTPTPNGHLPALFGGPLHVQLGERGFVRWIGPLEWIRDFNPQVVLAGPPSWQGRTGLVLFSAVSIQLGEWVFVRWIGPLE